MNKKMYLVNFDLEGFKRAEFSVNCNSQDYNIFNRYLSDRNIPYFVTTSQDKYLLNIQKVPVSLNNSVVNLSLEIPPLTFLGKGSAFNIKEGNTSAYFKYDNNKRMILIDCGSTVFSKLIEYNVLENIEELNICITHTHPDHIGSLGDLIFYMYYMKNIKVNLIISAGQRKNINPFLKSQGIIRNMYSKKCTMQNPTTVFIDNNIIIELYKNFSHSIETTPMCISISSRHTNNSIFYTGDISPELSYFEFANTNYVDLNNLYDMTYIEACEPDKGNKIHYPINELINNIPKEKRKYFTLMHFDSDKTIEMAKEAGFNIAVTIDESTKSEHQNKKERINKIYKEDTSEILRISSEYNFDNIVNAIKSKSRNIKDCHIYKDLLVMKQPGICVIKPAYYESLYNDILNSDKFKYSFMGGDLVIQIKCNKIAADVIINWIKEKFYIDLADTLDNVIKNNMNNLKNFFIFYNTNTNRFNYSITTFLSSQITCFPSNNEITESQDQNIILSIDNENYYQYYYDDNTECK